MFSIRDNIYIRSQRACLFWSVASRRVNKGETPEGRPISRHKIGIDCQNDTMPIRIYNYRGRSLYIGENLSKLERVNAFSCLSLGMEIIISL